MHAVFAWSRQASAATPHELTGLDVVRSEYGFRGYDQTVAIIDTGVAYDHVALGGGLGDGFRVAGGWDFAENDSDPYDDPPQGSHGSHLAGIVGAADGDPDTGVAPGVDLVALRVFDDTGAGSFEWIEQALQWVHENRNTFPHPITAVNLSFGVPWNSDVPPSWATLEEELAQLEGDGIFISAAAGNDFVNYETPGLSYPAASPHVVPVMSVDDTGQLSFYSQRHPRAIAAPGRVINSTVPDYAGNNDGVPDDYAVLSGTNMAAPYVAGASVLVREAMELAGDTDISQQTIYDHLMATADTFFDPATGQDYRRLNLAAAIEALIPEDDYGSTAGAAFDLGAVDAETRFSGLVGGSKDTDFFTFTPTISGTARLTTAASSYLDPNWVVSDSRDRLIVEDGGGVMLFPVSAGKRYTLALSSLAGIGRFDASMVVTSALMGDYDQDGAVSAADYTIWRDTLGSTDELQADGNGNGVVDEADYDLWRLALRSIVQTSIRGDYNDDGFVDAADYTVWRDTLGSSVDLRADGNGDGIVDPKDYAVWKSAYGTAGSASSRADVVAEPATTLLSAIALLVLAMARAGFCSGSQLAQRRAVGRACASSCWK